jgi:hypothetical protein
MNDARSRPDVRTGAEFSKAAGLDVTVHGRYVAAVQPVRGGRGSRPTDRALVELSDGTEVWLEPLDQPASIRTEVERHQFNGTAVRVRGRAHRVMPSIGQGLVAPCLTGVHDLQSEA